MRHGQASGGIGGHCGAILSVPIDRATRQSRLELPDKLFLGFSDGYLVSLSQARKGTTTITLYLVGIFHLSTWTQRGVSGQHPGYSPNNNYLCSHSLNLPSVANGLQSWLQTAATGAAQRPAILDRRCGKQRELRQAFESMLEGEARAATVMNSARSRRGLHRDALALPLVAP